MRDRIQQNISGRKFFFVLTFFLIGLTVSTESHGQNIVGKWKGVSVTNYYSADYAKEKGKSMEEILAKDAGYSEMDYNADHTFIMKFFVSNDAEATIMKGVWAVNGNQLKLTLEPQFNPKQTSTTASFSIHGDTMVTTAEIAPPSRIIKTISTATRL